MDKVVVGGSMDEGGAGIFVFVCSVFIINLLVCLGMFVVVYMWWCVGICMCTSVCCKTGEHPG